MKSLKERLAGIRNEANDYEVESMMNRVKSPLSDKVPYGKENRTPKKIRDDSLDRAVDEGLALSNKTKLRPKKPTQADRRRIISAKMREARNKINLIKKAMEEQNIAREHKHSIIFKGHNIGGFKSASLENQSGKYAKYWLLNAKQTNGNGWGIASHTAKENMKKFIGRPLVVTSSLWHGASVYGESFEHPYLPTNDMNQIFNHQEKFRVGNIVDVYEDGGGDWYASIEMLPKFANKTLPPFCSPAIYQLDSNEHEGNISKWEALHLAALTENPAYGARIALLRGTCIGTKDGCRIQFRGAKQLDAGYFNPRDKENDDNDLARSNQIHFNPGEKERTTKLESYILRSPNKKGRRVNQNQYRKYGDQESEANKEYTRNATPINPSIYPAGHKITTHLKRRLAKIKTAGRFDPQTPNEYGDTPEQSRARELITAVQNNRKLQKHMNSPEGRKANKLYVEKGEKINPKEHLDKLRRKMAGLNKKKIFTPEPPEDDEDRYDEIKEERERRFKIDVDRHIMRGQIICPKKLKEKLAAINPMGVNKINGKPKVRPSNSDYAKNIRRTTEFRDIFGERGVRDPTNFRGVRTDLKKQGPIPRYVKDKQHKDLTGLRKSSPSLTDYRQPVDARGIITIEKNKSKLSKLKGRLASLGEQNMTYQNSKRVKILKKKYPEVRKAQSDIEDKLRSMGRSVDASHAQSTWLSQKGDFIGGRGPITHIQQVNGLNGKSSNIREQDNIITEFSAKNNLPRVQIFPINRAGDKKVSIGIHSKINSTQLKSIQDLEKSGKNIGFGVGPTFDKITQGEGFSNLVKTLRENKFI